jgi:hypothetical protein
MKYQTLFLTTLLAFALAAPVPDYVDPDCVEEDLAVVEPGAYDAALGEPELFLPKGIFDNEPAEYDCEDEPFTDPPVQKQETTESECEDILTTPEPKVQTTPAPAECEDITEPTTPEPRQETTEAECIDDIVTTTPQQKQETTAECEDDFSNIIEVEPIIEAKFAIVPPQEMFDVAEIEECEDM